MNVINKIYEFSSEFFGSTDFIINSKSKKQEEVVRRQMVFYILRRTLWYKIKCPSLEEIGAPVGKNHATVIHGINKVQGYLSYDKKFKENFEDFVYFVEDKLSNYFENYQKEEEDYIKLLHDIQFNNLYKQVRLFVNQKIKTDDSSRSTEKIKENKE